MPSKCKHENCKKYASYNYPDQKGRIYCKTHAKDDMISNRTDNRTCIHPDHNGDKKKPRASFNFPDQKKPKYCSKHSKTGMINFNTKNNMCKECKIKQPSYGKPNGRPEYCSKCSKNKQGLVDLVSNLCNVNDCNKNATYGFVTDKKATKCKTHAEIGMIDIKNNKCVLCDKQPTFGLGKKATHCKLHKTDEMTDVKHNSVLCQECNIRATYGLKDKPTHCKIHKTDEMKDLVSRMCGKCNKIQGHYGYSSDDKILFCVHCKEENMTHVKGKKCENCNLHQPTFNFKGIKPPRFCAACALDGMVDVINPKCKSCGLFMVNRKPYLCSYCKPDSAVRQKTKEMTVVNYLQEKVFDFIHNKSVGFVCGNYRPDIKIDANDHFVIVEIDEDQHSQYNAYCEIARMFNILQAIGLPCTFIRYNPDVFRVNGIAKKVQTQKRLEKLNEVIKQEINIVPENNIKVLRLFYNNTTGNYTEEYSVNETYKNLLNNLK